MLRRVYIETTIPSFYFTLRKDAESVARRNWTRQWWSEFAGNVELASIVAVINELQRGSGSSTAERINLLTGMELLEITEEVTKLSEIYVSRLVMPRDTAGDALHLALASFHRVDILLTWNCRHLANPNKMEHIRLVNYEVGLPLPVITTPMNYLGEGGL